MIDIYQPQADQNHFAHRSQNLHVLRGSDVHIWIVNLDQQANQLSYLIRTLDENEISQAKQFKFDSLKSRFILSHGILRNLISQYLGIAPQLIHFQFNEYGKPELDPGTQTGHFYFNMAHSGSYAIYAFSNFIHTGVDIEKWRTDLDFDQLVTTNFSADEIAAYNNFPMELQQRAFFNGWTRKEAYIKAVGSGLYLPLDQFSVSITLENEVDLHLTDNSITDSEGWFLRGLDVVPGYSAAVAVLGVIGNLFTWNWCPK